MTTLHSIERAKERIGMNRKAAEHMMKNALVRGIDKTMFTNEQKRQWLNAKESASGCKALVYNGTCFIVSPENVIITLYPLPGWFTHSNRYDGKERIRNQAKFEKFNKKAAEANWIM